MISLLRNIRRALLNEGKLIRYLSYAVGEVLLIIIGILMALKISDWNEGKKLVAEEREILTALREELKVNQDILKHKMSKSNSLEKTAYRIIEAAAKPESEVSSEEVDQLIADMSWWQGSDWVTAALEALISSGDLSLIRDKTLQQSIAAWTEDVDQVREIEDREAFTYHELYLPLLISKSDLPQIANYGELPPWSTPLTADWSENFVEMPLALPSTDHTTLLKDQEFQNLILVRHWDHQGLRLNYDIFGQKLENLLQQIEEQLEQ